MDDRFIMFVITSPKGLSTLFLPLIVFEPSSAAKGFRPLLLMEILRFSFL